MLPVLVCASIRRASTPLVFYLPPYTTTTNYKASNTFTTIPKIEPYTQSTLQNPHFKDIYFASLLDHDLSHIYTLTSCSPLKHTSTCLRHEQAARATTVEAAQPKAQLGKTSSTVRSPPNVHAAQKANSTIGACREYGMTTPVFQIVSDRRGKFAIPSPHTSQGI